jgi:hypothetical protein
MEVGVRSEDGGIELATARGDGGAEVVERGEMPIDDRLIQQRPEMLGGLEFGRVGRQEDQADPVRNREAFGAMPASVVEHEDDAALAARTGLAGEGGEQFGKEGLGEAGAEIPERLAAGRLHEGGDVQPLVAVMAEGDRPLTDRRPDPAADRLQAKAVLVLCPDLDRAVGVRRPGRGDSGIQPPLKAARCSGVAARGCCGRGA